MSTDSNTLKLFGWSYNVRKYQLNGGQMWWKQQKYMQQNLSCIFVLLINQIARVITSWFFHIIWKRISLFNTIRETDQSYCTHWCSIRKQALASTTGTRRKRHELRIWLLELGEIGVLHVQSSAKKKFEIVIFEVMMATSKTHEYFISLTANKNG